jgi:hypothetical protein
MCESFSQIHIDVPRTNPTIPLFQYETTQQVLLVRSGFVMTWLFWKELLWQCLERILYVWAIRHPASGYVQGINDLVTPFFQVFLSAYIGKHCLLYAHSPSTYLQSVLITIHDCAIRWWSRNLRHQSASARCLECPWGWLFLESIETSRWHPRQLHVRTTWNTATDWQVKGTYQSNWWWVAVLRVSPSSDIRVKARRSFCY